MTDHESVSPHGTSAESVRDADIANVFLTALAMRNFQRLETCFHPDMRFRALVPPGLRTGTGPQETVGWFSTWFSHADHFEVVQSEVDQISDRLRIAYRIRLHDSHGWQVVEQQLYCTVKDKRIEAIDLLCSGFRPEASWRKEYSS
ncbi:MAG: nuclear transport factor 2-like protein [Ktedonobacteraceae bacterium]